MTAAPRHATARTRTARFAAVAIAIVLTQGLVACGGSDDASDTSTSETTAASDSATESDDSAEASDDSGSSNSDSAEVDCDAVTESFGAISVPLQVMAQLQTAEQWDAVATGVISFDETEFQAGIEGLRPLESLPDNGADVAEALDVYSEAAALVAEAQQSPDPASSEANASLTVLTSDTTTFLMYQSDIAMARDEAGC